MRIEVEAGIEYAVHVEGEGEPVVLIHGFTGGAATWHDVVCELKARASYKIITVDMLGHGQSSIPIDVKYYNMTRVLAHLKHIFTILHLESIRLVGYSMGGRIALAFTVTYPELVRSLVLESASPGLKTEQEQLARRLSDDGLAQKIEQNGLAWFADFWGNIPLFASQKRLAPVKQEQLQQVRLNNNAVGLANSLRGIGTGSQLSYWDKLSTVNIPVTLIVGQEDKKYVVIAHEMKQSISQVTLVEIEQAGHNIHLEQTEQYVEHLIQALKI